MPELHAKLPSFQTLNTDFPTCISHCFLFPILFTTPRQVHPLLSEGLGEALLLSPFLLRRGLGRLFPLSPFLLRRSLGRLFLSLLSFPSWTIFTFPLPYFLFFLPNPSFLLFVTLRFSMRYSWYCKRACFALQKGVFYIPKGHLLPCKRCSFTTRKGIYWKPIMKNLVSNILSPLSKTYWKVFQSFILTYS